MPAEFMNKDKGYLVDIAESMRLAVSHMGNATFEAFKSDVLKVDGVVRRLEIVGEATKRLSRALRDQHPEIPWQKMIGMRDVLIHAYNNVEVDVVYETVTEVIPSLIPKIDALTHSLPDPE